MDNVVKVNQKVPDFTLPDYNLKSRKLSEFFEKNVVLVFYPGAFTSVCTREMCTFRDSLAKFNELKAQIVGVSVNDPFSNKGFAEANRLTFPLLSDYKREVVKLYGVFHEDFGGLKGYTSAKRSVFIIDRKGIVRYVWISDDPGKEPNYDEIAKVLSELN